MSASVPPSDESRGREEMRNKDSAPLTESEEAEFSPAQIIGSLISCVLGSIAMIFGW